MSIWVDLLDLDAQLLAACADGLSLLGHGIVILGGSLLLRLLAHIVIVLGLAQLSTLVVPLERQHEWGARPKRAKGTHLASLLP